MDEIDLVYGGLDKSDAAAMAAVLGVGAALTGTTAVAAAATGVGAPAALAAGAVSAVMGLAAAGLALYAST